MRLIDADKLKNALMVPMLVHDGIPYIDYALVLNIINEQPTAEAEPIYHSTRKDENGVTWILGKNGWEKKEE